MKKSTKVISIIMVFVLLFSCFATQGVVTFADSKVWDGKSITMPEGKGTDASPYLVSNGAELAWMIRNSGYHYRITDDIFLNDTDYIDWTSGAVQEGYDLRTWWNEKDVSAPFSGVVDGNGHTVYGLYYKDDAANKWGMNGTGLIPVPGDGLSISKLGIDYTYVKHPNAASAFVGGADAKGISISLDQCFAGEHTTIVSNSAGAFVGAANYTVNISNSYSRAITNYSYRGGLVGDLFSTASAYSNVYNTTGSIGGGQKDVKCNNVYTTAPYKAGEQYTGVKVLTAAQMQGKVTDGNNMILSDAFVATEGFPGLVAFAGNSDGWNGLAEPFAGGDGKSEATAYEIATASQLAHAVALGDNKYYKLVNNIYINDTSKINWNDGTLIDNTYTPANWFSGTDSEAEKYSGFSENMRWSGSLDGNGYIIYGLWYSPDFEDTTAGLIPGATSAALKNIVLSESYIVGGRFIGAISSTFAGTAENIAVDETVTVVGKKNVDGSRSTGGIFGFTKGVTMRNCGFYGKLSGYNHVYGLIGTSWGTKIDVADSFSIGYQPFTTSAPTKAYSTKEEAEANALAYFQSIYKVENIYTDVRKQSNRGAYTYTADDATVTEYVYVFDFEPIIKSKLTGSDALDNMPTISRDFWCTTTYYPKTYAWLRSVGDVNRDGKGALSEDILIIRNDLLGIEENEFSDINGDGETDICDLVKAWQTCPTHYKTNGETYLMKHWMGYNDAVIVYAANDQEAKDAAESFRLKIAEKGLELEVYADTALAETENEVLFGKTNRDLYVENAAQGVYNVEVIENKVVFSAGTLSETDDGNPYTDAIKFFISLYDDGFAPIITGFHTFEGSVTVPIAFNNNNKTKTYTAVWGDEFYGKNLNPTKWDWSLERSRMTGCKDTALLNDNEIINVSDGRLRMTAKQYSVDDNAAIKYAVPASVQTKGIMEFKYGYAEIRAMVPYRTGVWPSFWMTGDTVLGGRTNYQYTAEVDMFEVFGKTTQLSCNVHKWYTPESPFYENEDTRHIMARGNSLLENIFGNANGEDTYDFDSNAKAAEWHVYGLGWDADYLYMYVDRELFKRYPISGDNAAKTVFGENAAKYDTDMSGFHDPLFVIFNNHLFTEEASYKPHTITGYESSSLPAHYDIDYFRLYQIKDEGQLWTLDE